MTETELYQKIIKKTLRKNNIYHYRVEYDRLPDVYMSKNGNSLWGELKCVNRKSNFVVVPDWRPGQLSWIRENLRHGSNNICLILWYIGEVYFLKPQEQYYKEELVCQMNTYLKNLNQPLKIF